MAAKTWLMGPAVLGLVTGCGGTLAEEPRVEAEAQAAQGLATCETVSLLKDIHPTGSASPGGLTAGDGVFFFVANNGVNGVELWKSDGTAAGTVLVKDIHPSGNGATGTMAFRNGTLFLVANDGVSGTELWKSDGTAAGTVLVKDLQPGDVGSSISHLTFVGDTLFFTAKNSTHGTELWKSDGTAAGTVLVKDINTVPTSSKRGSPTADSSPRLLRVVDGVLLFVANDGVHGEELWRSDGTAAGTVLVKDIVPGSGSPNLQPTWVVGSRVVFLANDGVHGMEPWGSDGTAVGTVLLKDIYPGATGSTGGSGTWMRAAESLAFFDANDGVYGRELWKSDGTPAGTVMVKDITPGADSTPFSSYTYGSWGNTVFFSGQQYHLWKSDGTEEGTAFVANPSEGRLPACTMWCVPDFQYYRGLGGAFYFGANDGIHGNEMWKTDGTTAGTALVHDINPGSGAGLGNSAASVVLNSSLYFSGYGPEGDELWRITQQPCP